MTRVARQRVRGALLAVAVAASPLAAQSDPDASARAVLDALAARLAADTGSRADVPATDVLDVGATGSVEEATAIPGVPTVERALAVAREALVAEQSESGTWGGFGDALPTQGFWSNVHTH